MKTGRNLTDIESILVLMRDDKTYSIAQIAGYIEESIKARSATQAKGGSREESLFLVTYRYTNRTDASIHEDTVSAIDCEEAVTKVCANHNFEVEWHTVKEIELTPPVTPQDEEKNVFARKECIFKYCPHPEECKDACQCTADDLNKKIEKDNKVIEKMSDLSNIDMNTPYGSTQIPTPSTHSEVGDIEKAWRTYSDTFSNADTSGWQDLMDKESFFEAAKSLTPTKPVEITEEEIIHFMRIGLEYLEDADGSGRFFGEREVAKAILTKLNGER